MMTKALISQTNWRYLLREVVKLPGYRELTQMSAANLQNLLAAPASLAFWIDSFAPELKTRQSLRVAFAGASFGQDSIDGGRWYHLLPALLGIPDLKVEFDLVGKELSAANPPTGLGGRVVLADRMPDSPVAKLVKHYPAAAVHCKTLGEYLDSNTPSSMPDLIFMFHPGFQEHADEWILSGDLRHAITKEIPIGVAAYAEDEFMQEAWMLDAYGYAAEGALIPNRFSGVPYAQETPFPAAFAHSLWKIGATLPERDAPMPEASLEKNKLYEDWLSDWAKAGHELPPLSMFGKLASKQPGLEGVVPLPNGLFVELESGIVLGQYEDGTLDETEDEVPSELLAQYPANSPLDFNRAVWAIQVMESLDEHWAEGSSRDDAMGIGSILEMAAKLRGALPRSDDENDANKLFPFNSEDMMSHMGEFLRQTTGKDVDPAQFLEQMRLQGGIHGPVHPAWHDLLLNLNWTLKNYEDEPKRFQPAFFTPSRDERALIPVVCENYAYVPGDVEDALVNEAKGALAKAFPRGVLLLFKSMMYKEVSGKKYSFGGLVYWRDQWRPFALCETMESVDAVLAQFTSGFSFNAPSPEYTDRDGRLACALNFMTHGADPNGNQRAVALKQGDWACPMPA